MKLDDAQLGFPQRLYPDTKTNIEALVGVPEGSFAYATGVHQIGSYNGTTWDWVTPGFVTHHDLLSATHPDTLASAPVRGGLLYANATSAWAQLAKGAAGTYPTWDANDLTVSKLILTQPATSATLTIADGKTLTVNNILTLSSPDSLAFAIPAHAAGWLHNDGVGTLGYSTPTYTQVGAPGYISADRTIIVAPSGGDYTTVQDALNSIANQLISLNATITIQVNDGTYISTSPISVPTLYGRTISIHGQNTYTKTISSIQSSSGSAGAWSLVLNIDSVTNIAVNDYIAITAPTGGSNPTYLAGAFKITNVDAVNTRITITSYHQASTAPSGVVTSAATILKTILVFNGCDGVDVWNGGAVLGLTNVAVVGDRTTAVNGISIQDLGRFVPGALIAVVGFGGDNILAYYQSQLISSGYVISSGAIGNGATMSWASVLNPGKFIATGNSGHGLLTNTGSQSTSGLGSIFSGNGLSGSYTQATAYNNAANSVATGNLGYGYLTDGTGVIASGTASGNTTGDYALANNFGGNLGTAFALNNGGQATLGVLGGTATPAFTINGTGYNGGTHKGILSINGNSALGASINLNTSAAGGRNYTLMATGTGSIGSAGGFGIYDDTGGAWRAVIDSSGNIGLGTTSPGYKLDVNGVIASEATANQLVLQSAGVTGTITWTPTSSNKVFTIPDATGTATLGTGTASYVPRWSGTNTLGNGIIQDNGTTLGITVAPSANIIAYLQTTTATNTGLQIRTSDDNTTKNLMEWKASGSTILGSIGARGKLTISSLGGIYTTSPLVFIDAEFQDSAAQTYGMSVQAYHNATTTNANVFTGMNFDVRQSGAGNTSNYTQAVNIIMRNNGAGLVSFLDGLTFQHIAGYTGNITNARGFVFQSPTISSSGTITNLQAIVISNLTAGTSLNNAIVTGKGWLDIGDYIHITGWQDHQQLIVKAHSTQTTYLVEHQDSSANVHNRFTVAHASNVYENVLNEQGSPNLDFRVESDTYNAIFIDASNDSIVLMSNVAGKLGFYGVTAIVQPTTAIAGATRVGNAGNAVTDADTWDGYTLPQIAKIIRNLGLAA